jgi:hypothetical protein
MRTFQSLKTVKLGTEMLGVNYSQDYLVPENGMLFRILRAQVERLDFSHITKEIEMGKQICFFVTQKDVNALVEQIHSYKAFVVNAEGQRLNDEDLLSIADYDYCQKHFGSNKFFIVKPEFALCFYFNINKNTIDEMKAEVISFSLCSPQPERIVDTSPVDNNFRKNGFIVIDDSDEYQRQLEELMKNPTYIDNSNYVKDGFEHGRFWYSPQYYDVNGNNINKSKELDTLFNGLSKFVKKNFRQSKDEFAYIGPDTYEKYQEGVFIPCSGRNKIVI